MLKWFKKLGKRAEKGIDKTVENVDDIAKNTTQLIADTRSKIEMLSMLVAFSLALGVVSNIVSISVNTTILNVHKKFN